MEESNTKLTYTNRNRHIQFDFARSLCVLWIVAFWHLQYYLPEEMRPLGEPREICRTFTNVVLSTFTFLSGFFLKKYEFKNSKDVLYFYKKRLQRFYPLYALAVVSMILICGGGLKTLIASIFGVSIFTNSPIHTLWYFSMLLSFYILTPLLSNICSRGGYLKILAFLLIYLIGYFVADKRFVIYLPFYVLGLNTSLTVVDKYLSKKLTLIISALTFISLIIVSPSPDNLLCRCLYLLVGSIMVLSFCYNTYNNSFKKVVEYIAYSSMVAYLFHRQLYQIAVLLLRHISSLRFMTPIIAIVAIIVLFVGSYFVQKLYDVSLNKVLKSS